MYEADSAARFAPAPSGSQNRSLANGYVGRLTRCGGDPEYRLLQSNDPPLTHSSQIRESFSAEPLQPDSMLAPPVTNASSFATSSSTLRATKTARSDISSRPTCNVNAI